MWLFNPYGFTELFKVWKLSGVSVLPHSAKHWFGENIGKFGNRPFICQSFPIQTLSMYLEHLLSLPSKYTCRVISPMFSPPTFHSIYML